MIVLTQILFFKPHHRSIIITSPHAYLSLAICAHYSSNTRQIFEKRETTKTPNCHHNNVCSVMTTLRVINSHIYHTRPQLSKYPPASHTSIHISTRIEAQPCLPFPQHAHPRFPLNTTTPHPLQSITSHISTLISNQPPRIPHTSPRIALAVDFFFVPKNRTKNESTTIDCTCCQRV